MSNPFAGSKSPWLQCWQPNPNPQLRLFCFPYSGAGASIYRPWAQALPTEVEVWGIQLPGRERRLKEPLLVDLEKVINHLLTEVSLYLDHPYAFYGHSLGALIAFALASRQQTLKLSLPICLIVAGRQAPHIPSRQPEIHLAPDSELIAELRQLEGTPEVVLQEPSLMQLFLPILRADLQMNETYIHKPTTPLNCPILALGGSHDPKVSQPSLQAWHSHTSQSFNMQMFDGNHFFLKAQQFALLEYIEKYVSHHLLKNI